MGGTQLICCITEHHLCVPHRTCVVLLESVLVCHSPLVLLRHVHLCQRAYVHITVFQGAVFDVPSEDVDTLLEEFEKIKEEGQRLEKLDTLPQLKYSDFESVTSRYEGRPGSRYKSRPGSRYESRPGNRHESRPSSAYGRSSSQVNHSFGDRPRFSSPRRRPSYFEDDDDDDDNDIDNDNFQGGYNRRSNFRQQKPQNRGLYYSDLNDRYGRNNRY